MAAKPTDFYTFFTGVNGDAVATALTHTVNNVTSHEGRLDMFEKALDTGFMVFSGYLVFFMQLGFAMITAGSVRTKNVKNVLLKSAMDACVGAVAYYIFGYAFAYGSKGAFIGHRKFAITRGALADFFYQWTFAATAATIVSGSVAERTSFYAYMAYAFFLTGFVYPVVSHWVWGDGFLQNIFQVGVIDFAGCSVVHMVGGFAGLIGAAIVGPRIGRFNSAGEVQALPGHSATLVTMGTFVLWFGWYGFNPGSAMGLSGDKYRIVERCAVNTTLAAAAGGLTTLVVKKLTDYFFDLLSVLNGILAGLVAITASCAFVETYAALIIGAVGALVYMGTAKLMLKVRIDDPLEAFPVHGAAGFWGLIAVGLFNRNDLQGLAGRKSNCGGLFYGGPNVGKLLGINLLGGLIVIVWTIGLITPMFLLLNHFDLLRISRDEEIIGNDVSKHGGAAYPNDHEDDLIGAVYPDDMEIDAHSDNGDVFNEIMG